MSVSFCLKCKLRKDCKKICEGLDIWLKKNIARYQREWIVGGTNELERLQQIILEKQTGRKFPRIYSD